MYERTREKIELTEQDKLRLSSDWFPPLYLRGFFSKCKSFAIVN